MQRNCLVCVLCNSCQCFNLERKEERVKNAKIKRKKISEDGEGLAGAYERGEESGRRKVERKEQHTIRGRERSYQEGEMSERR